MNFDRVVDAITPDPEVAAQAKEFRKKAEEEVEAQRKAAEPKPEDLGPADSLTDFERYSQARRIADLVFEYVSPDWRADAYMQDWRKEGINPYYSQTHRGFFLEAYYGQLSKLHTPWGLYGFGGSGGGSWKDIEAGILGRLGVTIHKEVRNTEMGIIGPIYAIHKIDDIELPDPVERPRSQYVPYEEVKKATKTLEKQYRAIKVKEEKK